MRKLIFPFLFITKVGARSFVFEIKILFWKRLDWDIFSQIKLQRILIKIRIGIHFHMDRKQVFNNKIRNSLFLRPFEFYVYKCFKPKRIFVRICAVSFLRFFHILTFKRRESRGGYRELRSAKICDALAKYLPNVIAVSMRCRYSHSLKNKKPSY